MSASLEYCVCCTWKDSDELEERVLALISEGWRPIGGIGVAHTPPIFNGDCVNDDWRSTRLYQAMIRESWGRKEI